MNTFFTPVDSPDHSDDEDSRRLSRSSELFKSVGKLTSDKVDEIIFALLLHLIRLNELAITENFLYFFSDQ